MKIIKLCIVVLKGRNNTPGLRWDRRFCTHGNFHLIFDGNPTETFHQHPISDSSFPGVPPNLLCLDSTLTMIRPSASRCRSGVWPNGLDNVVVLRRRWRFRG